MNDTTKKIKKAKVGRADEGWLLAPCRIKVSTAERRDCSTGCPHLFIEYDGKKKKRICRLDVMNPVELLPPRKRRGKSGDENAAQAAQRSEFCISKQTHLAEMIRKARFESFMTSRGM